MSGEHAALERTSFTKDGVKVQLGEILEDFARAIEELAPKIAEVVALYVDKHPFLAAYIWAKANHPEWVSKIHAVKTDRARKKYYDRIMRAYRRRFLYGEDNV